MVSAGEVEKLIPVTEAAEILNVHPNTMRLWSFMGVVKSYKLGPRGDWKFKRSEIEEYLEGGREWTNTEAAG